MVNLSIEKEAIIYKEVKTLYSFNGVEKTEQIQAENETRSLSYTAYKNKLKMDLNARLRQ